MSKKMNFHKAVANSEIQQCGLVWLMLTSHLWQPATRHISWGLFIKAIMLQNVS